MRKLTNFDVLNDQDSGAVNQNKIGIGITC